MDNDEVAKRLSDACSGSDKPWKENQGYNAASNSVPGSISKASEARRMDMLRAGVDSMAKSAVPNDRQVGGDHYRNSRIQHWDWASAEKLDYFQGEITGYLARWKRKGPSVQDMHQDLLKGFHYYEKYLEVWRDFLPAPEVKAKVATERVDFTADDLRRAAVILERLRLRWEWVGGVGGGLTTGVKQDIFRCRFCKTEMWAESIAHANDMHPNCSGNRPEEDPRMGGGVAGSKTPG